MKILGMILAGTALAGLPVPASTARADAGHPAQKPAAPAAAVDDTPVSLGDSLATVIQKLGAPTGTFNGHDHLALFYKDGQIEIRNDKVTRLRWNGVVKREGVKPVRLARVTAGTLTFRKADPNADVIKTRAERAEEEARLKEANSRIRVVSVHHTNQVVRAEAPASAPEAP